MRLAVGPVQKKLNLTRTVRKLPIDANLERAGHYIHDDRVLDIKYDEELQVSAEKNGFIHNRGQDYG